MFGVKLLRARIRDKGVDQGGLLLRQEGLGNLHPRIIKGFTFLYRKEREGRCLNNSPLRMSKRVLIFFSIIIWTSASSNNHILQPTWAWRGGKSPYWLLC